MKSGKNPFKDARIIHNKNGAQSVKEVSVATGISTSMINDLESNVGKERGVRYQDVGKLAKHYGVSTDYLIGLSSVYSPDTDLRGVCEYTGLSVESIRWIEDLRNEPYKEGICVLDRMLATEEFRNVISYIVYVTKIFDEIKNPSFWRNLSEKDQEALKRAQNILIENDVYDIYSVTIMEKCASAKQLLQTIFIEMVENLFFTEKEYGEFPLETPVGEQSTLII